MKFYAPIHPTAEVRGLSWEEFVMLTVLIGLGIIYYFTQAFGPLLLSAASLAAGWWMKGKYGDAVAARLASLKK